MPNRRATSVVRRGSRYVAVLFLGAAAGWLMMAAGWLPRPSAKSASFPDPLATPAERYAWSAQPTPVFPIPPYARFLEDVVIVLDPGHGGRGNRPNWKRGPTGLREAEVNLRVAQFLRDFLAAAGADVVMTRDRDVYLDADENADVRKRINLANELGADLFLSIHHNASDSAEANYTTLFYHRSADHSPASLCAARHLLTGLDDALRLERHLDCPLLNDTLVARRSGFAVLRLAQVPAVLAESSFHSNPAEEQRLRDPVYNRREAYGHFLGLARWAQAGLPSVTLVSPDDGHVGRGGQVIVALDDGVSRRRSWGHETVKILRDSLTLYCAGEAVPFHVELDQGQVTVTLPRRLEPGAHYLYVDFETIFGQHVLHPWIAITVGAGP
ncbi:MAG: N-acetylmuramoyl-L-alanine amidase [Planctomycetes bacterium]|nr:N-acetylmuramoyl-L-alanine amidase [Planctomycetota bacterium]